MYFSIFFLGALLTPVVQASPSPQENLYPVTKPASKHEPIKVIELPLPPVTLNETEGGCTGQVNPHGTGCIGANSSNLLSGNFLPDGNHVTASLVFTGAPASPDPRSIYTGLNLIIVRTNGTLFPNGDAWKCITCGVPANQQYGFTSSMDYQYPQAFTDGTRVLAGSYIIDCGSAQLASPQCTPDKVHIYPLRWNTSPTDSGAGGSIRELRKHPDDVHLTFNALSYSGSTASQYAYFARLQFNPAPTSGTPLTPRYDLVNVTGLYSPEATSTFSFTGKNVTINDQAIAVGEARGLNGLGDEVQYLGSSAESCNIDIFDVNLKNGKVARMTYGPEYVDPFDISPDGKWAVIMDTTTTNRMMFLSGMRGIPPLIDSLVTAAIASIRNNGGRRFFVPWVYDREVPYVNSDRSYEGQQVNAAGDGSPGSVNDPFWNGGADPRWSPDGTKIAYFQLLTVAPDCGGSNPLTCPVSTASGGRTARLMLATLTSRKPLKITKVLPVSDTIPWGSPYVPGSTAPAALSLSYGNFTLAGKVSGYADVTFTANSLGTALETVAVTYHNYSDNGENFIAGSERVTALYPNATLTHVDWISNLSDVAGISKSTKVTSPGGFHFEIDIEQNKFYANGTLTTTVDGVIYRQPCNGC